MTSFCKWLRSNSLQLSWGSLQSKTCEAHRLSLGIEDSDLLIFWGFTKSLYHGILGLFPNACLLARKKKKNLTFSIFCHLERLGTFKSSSTGSFLFDSSPLNLLYSLHILRSAVRRNQVTFPSLCLEISWAVHPALPPTVSAFCAAARAISSAALPLHNKDPHPSGLQ